MLIDFTVGNFGPFKDDMILSLEATTDKDHADNLITTGCVKNNLLSSTIIFGSNAAGKTYIVRALRTLMSIVRTIDEGIPSFLYAPYRVSKENRESPVRFKIRLAIDDVVYEYRVEYEAGVITYESLFHSPNNRMSRVFERTDPMTFKGGRKMISNITTPDRTYLAMASINGDPTCKKVRDAIIHDFIFIDANHKTLVQEACTFATDNPKRKEMLIKALMIADFGINDFTYSDRKLVLDNFKDQISPSLYKRLQDMSSKLVHHDILLRHDFTDADEEGSVFPIEIESEGTICMFGLLGPMIDALENGKILVIDDLGAHLHPALTRWIVKQFSKEYNPNGAQLIANTHEVGLMDIKGLLRRDQIWFVNKDRANGAADLYCLSDFDGVRKDADIMRRYLDGRFDAIPTVRHRGVI